MPPLGASPYTWPNIFKNMKRMDYCVDKFDFLGNREVCTPLHHHISIFFSCVEQGACRGALCDKLLLCLPAGCLDAFAHGCNAITPTPVVFLAVEHVLTCAVEHVLTCVLVTKG